MAVGIELERVQRAGGGKIHLTPHVPESGAAVTLCNQTFPEGTYRRTDQEADCRNCLRRAADPGRVSSAFFQSDVGAELLQRSLEQARAQRAERGPRAPAAPPTPPPSIAPPAAGPERPSRRRPAPSPPAVVAGEPAPPEAPDAEADAGAAPAIPELRSRTRLRRTFENVFVSPEGVILRVSAAGAVVHVSFNGPVDLRRRDGTTTVRVGDVVLELGAGS